MVRVSESAKLYVPAARVWEIVGDFNDLDEWHPSVLGCDEDWDGTRQLRKLDIGAGSALVERLESRDEAAMSYTYTLIDGPLPVRDYESTIEVHADDANSCTVEWSSSFEPAGAGKDEAVETVRDFYRAGLESLRFTLGG